ncbi:MAG TPA: hypothetical protein VFE47_13160 [Tepidisphaeraceae bacterium]|jgi:hypothetical protein|nr:hypothetical protein [Tepidisphaeraceae bacterium]
MPTAHPRVLAIAILCFLAPVIAPSVTRAADATRRPAMRPAMRDFMGLNTHTVGFRPDLYAPVCRNLRDYHPFDWDVGNDTSAATKFPMTVNGVSWEELYGNWTKKGYNIDSCIMFDGRPSDSWHEPAKDARVYGEAFARFFGPSGKHPWVTSVEIGNEPAKYSTEKYREIFQAMASGVRVGDPKMKIATCAVMTGKPDQWSKPMAAIDGLGELFDVVNIHSYAFKDGWPTWHRSYPEDPSIRHLKDIEDVIQYRNAHFQGKQFWLTEFGYDAASHPPDPKGEWSKWAGVTDEQQAEYIVRSFLVFSAMDIDRAYLYFFDDKDQAQLHGASGITRNYKPKPSFYAMSYLYKTLGDYHFVKAVSKKEGDLYCYEYAKAAPSKERAYVAWLANGDSKWEMRSVHLGQEPREVYKIARMPMTNDPEVPQVEVKREGDGVDVSVGPAPVFILAR